MPPSQPTSGSSQSLVQWIILSACIMGLVIIVAVVVLRRARSRGAAKSAGAVGSSSISAAARSKTHGRRKKSGKGRASVTVAPAPPSHDEDERPHEGLTLQAEWEESGCLSTRAQRSGFLQKSSGSPRPSSRAVSAASTAPAVMQACPRKPGRGQVAGTSGGRLPPLSSPQAASTVSSSGAGGATGKRHGGAQPAESLRLHSRAMVSQSPDMSPAPRSTCSTFPQVLGFCCHRRLIHGTCSSFLFHNATQPRGANGMHLQIIHPPGFYLLRSSLGL
jgi:hypothetical protein